MDCRLIFTANAGCILYAGELCILLDALHNQRTAEFSSLSPAQLQKVFELLDNCPPKLMLITHRHPDHYSPELTAQARERYPEMLLIRPSGAGHMERAGMRLEWFPLPHRGGDGPNFGFLLDIGGKRIFTAGDAEPGAEETLKRVAGLSPELALLNFPWLSLRSGRQAFERLNPRQTCLFHLPFAEDDSFGYLAAVKELAGPLWPNVRVLCQFLQEENFKL